MKRQLSEAELREIEESSSIVYQSCENAIKAYTQGCKDTAEQSIPLEVVKELLDLQKSWIVAEYADNNDLSTQEIIVKFKKLKQQYGL